MRRQLAAAVAVSLAACLAPGHLAEAQTRGEGQGNTITIRDDRGSGSTALPVGISGKTGGPVELTPVQLAYQFCMTGGGALQPAGVVALCAQFMTPAAPGAPAPPPPTAADIATTWSQSATLPNPTLRVRPGYAVTGLTAYLEIGTPTPWTVSIPDPVRNDAITISCGHTSFDVSWGDGTPPTQATSTGGPYPNGDVTHVYQQAAQSYTLSVTEHWGCRWSDPAGNGGTLTGLRSAGQLPLEVREIQTTN